MTVTRPFTRALGISARGENGFQEFLEIWGSFTGFDFRKSEGPRAETYAWAKVAAVAGRGPRRRPLLQLDGWWSDE